MKTTWRRWMPLPDRPPSPSDNARLFSETDQQLSARVEELQQLRRIDRLLNETLDANKAMQITLEWACRLSGRDQRASGLDRRRSSYMCAPSIITATT